jgi:glycerophosphoryl diester phosphodiesterase
MKRIPPERFCVGVTNEPDELAFWMTQDVHQVGSDRPDLALAARRATQ